MTNKEYRNLIKMEHNKRMCPAHLRGIDILVYLGVYRRESLLASKYVQSYNERRDEALAGPKGRLP